MGGVVYRKAVGTLSGDFACDSLPDRGWPRRPDSVSMRRSGGAVNTEKFAEEGPEGAIADAWGPRPEGAVCYAEHFQPLGALRDRAKRNTRHGEYGPTR